MSYFSVSFIVVQTPQLAPVLLSDELVQPLCSAQRLCSHKANTERLWVLFIMLMLPPCILAPHIEDAPTGSLLDSHPVKVHLKGLEDPP